MEEFWLGLLAGLLIGLMIEWLVDWRSWRRTPSADAGRQPATSTPPATPAANDHGRATEEPE